MKCTVKYEHRSGLSRGGSARLMTKGDALGTAGYISVWGYPALTEKVIEDQGSTSGLMGLPLFTDLLYLDIDDAPETVDAVEDQLQRLGWAYEMYDSGNRGAHFHIPCVEVTRTDLPMLVKRWVAHYFPYKGVDDSLYKTSGIIRTEGTFHHKRPGAQKRFVGAYEGSMVDLLATLPDAPMPRAVNLGEDREAGEILSMLWLDPATEGGRNHQIYRRSYLARLAGIEMGDLEDMLLTYNELMVSPPLPEREVLATMRSAYRG